MAAATPFGNASGEPQRGSALWLNILKVAIIAVIAGGSLWMLLAHREWFEDPRQVKVEVLAWGVWGPVIYMALYAVGPSFLVPGAVMTIAGGLAFGTLWGSVYSLIGADIGAIVAFGAGRFLGRGFVESVVGKRFDAMLARIARHGFHIILYLRMVPVIPYNALNLIAGASRIDFRDYLWASVIGMIPGTILFAFLGDALWHPLSPRFFIALLLISISVGCGEIWRRRSSVKIEA
ncbi:MAG TPA: TVP38/TMEM64 family protein [Candidatus Binataceae bacterium]|nr:TVP38/TMEM64 family protein [Candidatus Binataceae bacterium]